VLKSLFLIAFLWALPISPSLAQDTGYTRNEAGIDSAGNIYVGSDQGHPIQMASRGHCIEGQGSADGQTIACLVPRGTGPNDAMQSQRIEIYMRNGKTKIIETTAPIAYWHFWEGARQIAVVTRSADDKSHYALYETPTATLLEHVEMPADLALLPLWAKSRDQIEDESVPTDKDYDQQVTKWIAKAMRRIQSVRPGMTRQDLLRVFSEEGGVSTRFSRTYVYSDCRLIKVTVHLKAAREDDNGQGERADDIIESISQPYLDWGTAD
jgi:hypothetical protein